MLFPIRFMPSRRMAPRQPSKSSKTTAIQALRDMQGPKERTARPTRAEGRTPYATHANGQDLARARRDGTHYGPG